MMTLPKGSRDACTKAPNSCNSWSFMAIHVQKLKFYEGEEYMEGAHW